MALPSVDPSLTAPTGTATIATAYNDRLQAVASKPSGVAMGAGQAANVASPTGGSAPASSPASGAPVASGSGSTTPSNPTPGNTNPQDTPPAVGGTNTITVGGIVRPSSAPAMSSLILPGVIVLGIFLFLEYR